MHEGVGVEGAQVFTRVAVVVDGTQVRTHLVAMLDSAHCEGEGTTCT